MDTHVPQFQTKSLQPAADRAAYKLYRAALEWDLVDPILIEDRKDLKSEYKWRDHVEPYHHQVKNLIAFCRRLPVTLLADDVGLGKTISAGLIASELMSRGRISQILVVCPKLLMPQWKEELESKFDIPCVIAIGKDLLSAKSPKEGGAVVTTYHSARLYLDAIGHAGYDMLVLDEAHKRWVKNFDGTFHASLIHEVQRCFTGAALVRVRATVAHDSYERLVEVSFSPNSHWSNTGLTEIGPISEPLQDPSSVGVDSAQLTEKATLDEGIAEFCRFYIDRRTQEVEAAGTDPRKKKKIEDDFTPRVEALLVGLEGSIHRQLKIRVSYDLGSGPEYRTAIVIIPFANKIVAAPELRQCAQTGKIAPSDCLGRCEISGVEVLRHLLVKSEVSGRMALPEHTVACASSGRRALRDEVEQSSVTGQLVIGSILKASALSGKRAEPQYFVKCEFTGADVLENEVAISDISGRKYRVDEQLRSAVSGKSGHRREFAFCAETNRPLLPHEAETCEVTGKIVMPGSLERCDVTGKAVLHSELEKSAATGKKALKKFFVSSSISGARLLEEEATRSATGKYCVPQEAKSCIWSGRRCHPDDLRTCQLTGVTAHFEYMTTNGGTRLELLFNLLNGIRRTANRSELWATIIASSSDILSGRSKVEAAESSPSGDHLAVCVETKNWLGLKTRQAGLLYSVRDNAVVGRIVSGRREEQGWTLEKTL